MMNIPSQGALIVMGFDFSMQKNMWTITVPNYLISYNSVHITMHLRVHNLHATYSEKILTIKRLSGSISDITRPTV